MSTVIALNNIQLHRKGNTILGGVDWQVDSSERWVIIGPNGAGKTSLLRVAAAQLHPTSGEAVILGEKIGKVDVFDLRTRVGFCSTALANYIPGSERVLDVVMTASYGITGRWNELYEDIDERRARRVLTEWQLADFADRAYGTLSDGEKKRAQIARAVMPDPELLLLDEPVASLDLAARESTLQLLGSYASSPQAPAMVMVTHHLEEIPAGFTHAMILNGGQVFAAGELANTITSEKISEAYGMNIEVSKNGDRYSARAH